MLKTLLQNKEINVIIRREIIMALREIIDDPDFGLEFTEKAKKRMRLALVKKQKGISFSEIKKKYY